MPYSRLELQTLSEAYRKEYREAWKAVSSWVPSRTNDDALSSEYEIPTKGWNDTSLAVWSLGPGARRFLRNGATGVARVAVAPPAFRKSDLSGCTQCGNCQLGCPFGFVWNAATAFAELQERWNVKIAEMKVTKIYVSGDGVVAEGNEVNGAKPLKLRAKNVFFVCRRDGHSGNPIEIRRPS